MQTIQQSQYIFPNPLEVDPEGEGLICLGADLTTPILIEAYSHGLFPWFNEGEPICWWSPDPRCIIDPNAYKPSKTLLRTMKKYDYQITINQAFETVIRSCSLPRHYANETWISNDIITSYINLFNQGFGYSIEVWENDTLVGGLYGVHLGRGCFGESMFSQKTDVSKIAFYVLMLVGQEQNLPWIDCQLENDHLISLGATCISRYEYINSLQNVIKEQSIDWKKYQDSVFSSKSIAQSKQLNI